MFSFRMKQFYFDGQLSKKKQTHSHENTAKYKILHSAVTKDCPMLEK